MIAAADSESGTFYGVGVGPGDPELITLKAQRLIAQADVVSYIVNERGHSQARTIARLALDQARADQRELPVEMPMSVDRGAAEAVYAGLAEAIGGHLAAGLDVVFLCEGDPLFFGSFAYLLERLQHSSRCEVVPGISSVHAASAALRLPLARLQESFAVVTGRHDDAAILGALETYDSVVIIKAGRPRERLLRLIEKAGRADQVNYLEYIGRDNQRIERDPGVLAQLEGTGPYFSLLVVVRDRESAS